MGRFDLVERDEAAPRFAIIGAGMSGILAGVRLGQGGYDFTIFEKADRVGGTWRENTYPGIACDVPSHIYSYSFELNPDWGYFCSPGSEIQSYFEDVSRRYELEGNIRFDDAVLSCEWTGDHWIVTTDAGYVDHVDFVIAATGVLHHPKMPDIEGIDSFEGPKFHSAQWDHEVELDNRRIGLIGTGSTGVQITGALHERVQRLSIFMRTAQWVMPIDQVAYDQEQRDTFRTDADLLQKLHDDLSDSFHTGFATDILDPNSGMIERIEELCTAELDKIADPELRAKLQPDYRAACKRLVISHNFYDAVQHRAVDIVSDDIAAIEPAGVRTVDGVLHEIDVLVLATGFHVDRFMRPIRITGQDGLALDDAWADRPSAYMSVTIPEFPNMFMLNGPNSPVGNFSLIHTAEMQMEYVLQLVGLVDNGQLDVAMPTQAAAERFEDERVEAAKTTIWATGCRSWYLDDRGIPFAWPFKFDRFRAEMSEPKLGDYELPTPATSAVNARR